MVVVILIRLRVRPLHVAHVSFDDCLDFTDYRLYVGECGLRVIVECSNPDKPMTVSPSAREKFLYGDPNLIPQEEILIGVEGYNIRPAEQTPTIPIPVCGNRGPVRQPPRTVLVFDPLRRISEKLGQFHCLKSSSAPVESQPMANY